VETEDTDVAKDSLAAHSVFVADLDGPAKPADDADHPDIRSGISNFLGLFRKRVLQSNTYQLARKFVQNGVADLEVGDESTAATAMSAYAVLKKACDAIKSDRLELTKPFDDLKTGLIVEANTFIRPIQFAMDKLGRRVTNWHEAERALAATTQKEAEERARNQHEAAAAEARRIGVPVPPTPKVEVGGPSKTIRTTQGSGTIARRWHYEITDPTLVPREFCVPAHGLIRDAVDAGARDIPGVRIYDDTSLSMKGGA